MDSLNKADIPYRRIPGIDGKTLEVTRANCSTLCYRLLHGRGELPRALPTRIRRIPSNTCVQQVVTFFKRNCTIIVLEELITFMLKISPDSNFACIADRERIFSKNTERVFRCAA